MPNISIISSHSLRNTKWFYSNFANFLFFSFFYFFFILEKCVKCTLTYNKVLRNLKYTNVHIFRIWLKFCDWYHFAHIANKSQLSFTHIKSSTCFSYLMPILTVRLGQFKGINGIFYINSDSYTSSLPRACLKWVELCDLSDRHICMIYSCI